MSHFAANHQAKLHVLDSDSRDLEIFPASKESALALGFRQTVLEAYARLPPDVTKETELSVYGPVQDFDRDFGPIIDENGGTRIAFSARYSSSRMPGNDRFAELNTVVSCQRRAESWSCTERTVDEASKATGIRVARREDGILDDGAMRRLLRAVLSRP
jgi:hypothetical protein